MASSDERSPRPARVDTIVDGSPTSGGNSSPPRFGLVLIGCCDTPATDVARLVWLDDIDRVLLARGPEFSVDVRGRQTTLTVPDGRVSQRHARIDRDERGRVLRDSSRNGTRVDGNRVGQHRLRPGEIIEAGHTFWRFVEHVPRYADLAANDHSIELAPTRTVCPRLIEELVLLRLAAEGKSPLLLTGPRGAGKETLARQIHAWSGRSGEFRALNCATLPAMLVEGELFGWVRDAHDKAHEDRPGRIEEAAGGTLLLDEIGDLPENQQPKLLRAIGEGEVSRLGESRIRKVDVRFVAATNRDLSVLRKDLLSRFERHFPGLPPLCDRREDLGLLIAHVLRAITPDRAAGIRMEPDVYRRLLTYDWPDNIRELEQALKRAILVSRGASLLRSAHLSLARDVTPHRRLASAPADASTPESPASAPPPPAARRQRQRPTEQEVRDALDRTHDVAAEAARLLGIQRTQMHRLMQRYGIPRPPRKPARRGNAPKQSPPK